MGLSTMVYGFGTLAATALVAAAGCDSSGTSSNCGVVNSTQTCVCTSGASGAQTCQDSGSWTVCGCGDSPADTVGSDTSADTTCTANCAGRDCGDDGCGASCGTCPIGGVCGGIGICECTADCTDRACGDNGCGGSCGTCTGVDSCTEDTDGAFACKNKFQGIYHDGTFVITTDRGVCEMKIGASISPTGSMIFFGVDPTTGETDIAFRRAECSTPFRGSSERMGVKLEYSGTATMSAPNNIIRPLRLVFTHFDFADNIEGSVTATVSGGSIVGEYQGLPQTVSIGLDAVVSKAVLTIPAQ
jgi:hypothetical protein